MNYRQFKLINEVGAEYDMCDARHFFANPDGLGFEKNISSSQTGNAFVLVNEKNNQQTITGEMIFFDYDEYTAFKEFIVDSRLKIAVFTSTIPIDQRTTIKCFVIL